MKIINYRFSLFLVLLFLFTRCGYNSVEIKNEHKGQLTATTELKLTGQKKFVIDNNTAPQPTYTQFYFGNDGCRYITFLNNYNNSIYFYDYDSLSYKQQIIWEKKGPNGIARLTGYYIKSLDSIYLYNMNEIGVKLGNEKGEIYKDFSLCNQDLKDLNWFYNRPVYYLQTVTPFLETNDEILLTGFFYGSIPDKSIANFKLTARFDFNMNKLHFSFGYPVSLYGSNYNWEGELYTFVYSDVHRDLDKLVFSFPVSHNLYIADLNTGEYQEVYGGSNFAGSICSLPKDQKRTTKEECVNHFMKQDVYAAIKYDKYRDVYYRFFLNAMPESSKSLNWKKKPISVIIMDKDFNYIGETVIGTGEDWYWQNSFVTQEGLNVEYIEKNFDEVYLTLKIFTLKKI